MRRGQLWMRASFLACLAVLSFSVTGLLLAQTQGQITGVVTDQSGAVVAGALVTVTNPGTGFTRQVVTTDAGNYVFPVLQPAAYDVRAEKPGFQSAERKGIDLQVNQVARIDFAMRVGAVSETVEVTGGAPLLATESATMGTVVDNRQIVELPLNGRNFLQLVALSPNVNASFANGGQAGSRQGGDRSTQQLSIAGSRREWNYFTLDGVDNTDVNFNTYIFLPSIDALQEFKVQTGIYSAEFGREAGQVNVSTKAGTNEYHGAMFEFLRNSSLDARPYAFTSQVPAQAPFRWNQYGFTLGGPVRIPKILNGRNRLFFMSNFEGFRLRNQTQRVYSLPTAAMQGGDFSAILPTVVRDPLTNQPFSGNIIPSNRLHPVSKKFLEFYPAANIPGAGLTNNYLALNNNITDKDQFTQRIDFVESSRSSWFGRYSWGDELAIAPALKLNGTNLQTQITQWMLDNTRILTPTLVNEFRFGYNHFFNAYGRELAFQRDVVRELGIPGLADPPPAAWGIPSVSILGFSGFGDDSEGPYVNYNHTFQWTDNISWTHGAHAFKIGAEIRRDRYNQLGNQFARGSFIIENQATGYGFADFMLGYTRRDEDSVALAITRFRATSQAYYLADTWKLRSNLTLDLGIRYEYVPPWGDHGSSLMNASVPANIRAINVADPNLHPVLVRIGKGDVYENTVLRFNPAIRVARDGRLGDRLVNDDKMDFAPRVGIAWSPSSKLTVRTGFGMFYSQDTGNPVFDMGRNLSGRVRVESNTQTHDLTFDVPFGAAGAASPCGVPTPPYVCISQPYVLGNKYDRRTPYIMQYELNIQRQLSNSTVAEIGYLGSQGHQLIRMFAFNEALPGATGSVTDRSPFPEFGRIQEIGNAGNSNYHSLSVKMTRRMTSGLTYLAGYTFSRSIDNGSGIRTLGSDPLFPQDSYCISCERGLSIFDTRHRFVSSVLYDLPFGKGRPFLNRGIASSLIGGWELSSIFTVSSGFPLTVTTGSDRANTGAGYDRPNATGDQVGFDRGQRNPNGWFNIGAFMLEPLGTFGNVGRNTLIGPGLVTWDFSTLKNFKFTESKYVQFRFEAFNFPNHANWSDPNTTLGSNRLDSAGMAIPGTGNFGRITGTRTSMRQLQFSLKLVF